MIFSIIVLKCTGNNKGICKKRTVRKQFIEDEVVAAIVGEHGILTDEFIDLVAAETYLLIQSEQNDTEIKRLENLIAENQKAINNLMQALMLGKIADTILSQIEKLENENKELNDTIATEKAMQIITVMPIFASGCRTSERLTIPRPRTAKT